MPINRDKQNQWDEDTSKSVKQYNEWFLDYTPTVFRETRIVASKTVENSLLATSDFIEITPEVLRLNPTIIATLRMACCPPIAVDRLIGLAGVSKNLVANLEEGKLPARTNSLRLNQELELIIATINKLLDRDIFPWIATKNPPSSIQRYTAATIVADRLCTAIANPIIRNAQEQRQLGKIEDYLAARGYKKHQTKPGQNLTDIPPGSFTFRFNVEVGGNKRKVRIPIDVVLKPRASHVNDLPILMEAKSAGDFTNTNKRQKEELTKARQLRESLGEKVELILFLCGYFDANYLAYEATENIDWIWEHRMEDLDQLGL
jgi:hypothetical protein